MHTEVYKIFMGGNHFFANYFQTSYLQWNLFWLLRVPTHTELVYYVYAYVCVYVCACILHIVMLEPLLMSTSCVRFC